MDLGKIGKKGFGNLGSGILGNHKKGGISSTPPLMGWLGRAERMQVQDVLEGGGQRCAEKGRGKMLVRRGKMLLGLRNQFLGPKNG